MVLRNKFIFLYRNIRGDHFPDNLEPLYIDPLKIILRPTDIRYELLTQDGKKLQFFRNPIIPLDQNLIRKTYIIKKKLQKFNTETFSVNHLVFLTIMLLMTLLHHSLQTNFSLILNQSHATNRHT